ncbi:hypothetical protein I0K15_20760 [Pontivivens ytuae]|uniref:Uncharacterized protein n=2 Tax=Pontivivens ytuae TaxID=2789856 RepID=A0A7S9LVZ9_9RHOB|nr:hypothetical protein I0K15_20760 [Pontivivens ytuae]
MPPHNPPGGAAVGRLSDLPLLEAKAICYLRLWCAGPEAQAEVWNAFAAHGPDAAQERMRDFEELVSSMIRMARRPLQRRHLGCACVSGDESAFGHMIAAAAIGEREDAMLLASLLVRPEAWMPLVILAEQVGLSLARMHLPMPASVRSTHPQTLRKH